MTSRFVRFVCRSRVWLMRIFILLLIGGAASGTALVLGSLKGLTHTAPSIKDINVHPQEFASVILDSKGNQIQTLADFQSNREEVSIEKIPENLQNAFIAIEDSRFYEHSGIDIQGILRAGIRGITTGQFDQGASTITQQLLKNNVFGVKNESTTERIERKIQEQYLAVELEKRMSKKEILEAYLNTINLGEGTLGVQSASKLYFGKDVSNLNLSECAAMAAITQNPTRYDPVTNPDNNALRRNVVLQDMLDQEMITKLDYSKALQDDVYSRISDQHREKKENESTYSYFVDALIEDVADDLENKLGYSETQAYNAIYRGGLTIQATQDPDIQRIVDKEFTNEDNFKTPAFTSEYAMSYQLSVLKSSGETKNYTQEDVADSLGYRDSTEMYFDSEAQGRAAAKKFRRSTLGENDHVIGETLHMTVEPQIAYSIMDQSTGYVAAIYGGRGRKSGNLTLNRATDTTKQPGSTFKVISTFAPGIDSTGITLGTAYDDCPYNYEESTTPVNDYYSGYRGLSTVRDAIRDSMNIVTAKCMAQVTPQVGYNYLKKMGISTLVERETAADGTVYSDIQQSLCLGGITRGVTTYELTGAYASIASGGRFHKPVLYTEVTDHKGNVLLKNSKKGQRIMKKTTAWLVTDAMKDVVSKGTGRQARLSSQMAVAGKTGTTSNNYDHWFVGYTPYYTAGIWCGYDSNKEFLSGGVEKNIWAKIMNQVIEVKNEEIKDFKKPQGITTATICTKCGNLAVEGLCDQYPGGSCVRTEYYSQGTAPTEKCTCHTRVKICKESGLPASDYCPKADVESRVYIIRPEDSVGITDDSKYELPSDFKDKVCDIHTGPGSSSQEPVSGDAEKAPGEASSDAAP